MPENVTPLEQEQRQAVRRIFTTLKIAFPAWYEKHYGDHRAEQLGRRVWMECVKDMGDDAVDRGLRRMAKECKHPPAPSEFVELCKHVEGLPTEDEAWDQALRGVYRHEAVRIAARETGTFDLRTARLDDRALRKVFSRNYAIVRARAAMGKPLDGEIPKAIAHQQQTPMQAQYANSHREARDLITAQGLPTDPKQARALLLAKMGIRRGEQAHG